ncbi:hypothetical protein MLD38_010291 [Melastoma candidum]|uniref:Uncharacterized protein n=1 Tax=Melastoma candidum TaxID=119954 RepID=A0ACB9R3F9_9MYRT|nr:hypothetical protein MLD38_010291 [Melastoma candidum]
MAVIEMQVHMDCQGCGEKIKKALRKLKGIHDVHIDIPMQKVTVMGFVDQRKVLRTVRKTGRLAQPWPQQYNMAYTDFADHYYDQPIFNQSHTNTYRLNARRSYADPRLSYSEMVVDQHITMFSDDNAHGCAIM